MFQKVSDIQLASKQECCIPMLGKHLVRLGSASACLFAGEPRTAVMFFFMKVSEWRIKSKALLL